MAQGKLSEKRLFLLDMDGTLYLGDKLFPGAGAFLSYVRESGGRYLFLTNNSSRGVGDYVQKLGRLGLNARPADFLTSVDALVARLKSGPAYRLHYVFGTASFRRQLQEAGLAVTARLSPEVDCLLCGFDTELTFQKLEDACVLLGRGAAYFATNPDWVCPTEFGYVPDCGSVCEMLYRATGRRPQVIGKPQPAMVELALERAGCQPWETLLVGDRLYTDIACGANAGIDTALVLSGESKLADVAASGVRPTYVFQDIQALHRACLAGPQKG